MREMNIIDELIESYTYNGVVSLKALEDDIATLENQIDSYNATVREIRLRMKNDRPIVNRIRDAKIRLSLLKATYKKVSEKMSTEDAIMNVLGISGNGAKEVEKTETAAENKEPIPQKFESTEAESEETPEEIPVAENKVESLVDLDMETGEITIKNKMLDGGVDYIIPEREEDKTEEQFSIEKDEEEPREDLPIFQGKPDTDEAKDTEAIQNDEEYIQDNGDVMFGQWVNDGYTQDMECVEAPDLISEDTKANQTKIEKEQETENETIDFAQDVYGSEIVIETAANEETSPEVEVNEVATELFSGKDMMTLDNLKVEPDYEMAPPPTFEDYMEPEEPETLGTYEDFFPEKELTNVFPPFDNDSISMSVDLHPLTEMVNTAFVYPTIDFGKKRIYLRFVDVRDYEVFLELARLRKRNHWWSKFFAKNCPTIFMTAEIKTCGSYSWGRFAFNNCRVVDVSDSEFPSCYAPEQTHECSAIIEYGNVTVLYGTTN